MGLFNRNQEEKNQTPRNPDVVFGFRVLAAGYILYTVYESVRMYVEGEGSMSLAWVIVCALLLGGGAVYILISSFLRWRKEKEEMSAALDAQEEETFEEETQEEEA